MSSRRTRRVVLIFGLGVGASLLFALLFRHYVIEEHLWRPGSKSERLHVLYLEGSAHWDYRFLSNDLLRDERVAAQVLLWGGADLVEERAANGLSPLRGLPPSWAALRRFDAVIVGDLDLDVLGARGASFVRLLETYVRRGGGLVVLSGGELEAYEALAALLPVERDTSAASVPGDAWIPELTPEGLALLEAGGIEFALASGRGSVSLRGDLRAKRRAEVLGVARELRTARTIPLLARWQLRSGRSVFVGLGDVWRSTHGVASPQSRFWILVIGSVAADGQWREHLFTTRAFDPRPSLGTSSPFR